MSLEKDDPLSCFRNLSLSQKYTIPALTKAVDSPYIVQMAVQRGVSIPKVAIACTDNDVRILSRDSLISEGNLKGHCNTITDVDFGKTDTNLVFSSSTDQTVRCWDIRGKCGKETQKFKAPTNGDYEFLCVDSSHSDVLLCAGTETAEGEDTHLLFWDRRASSLLGSYTESHDDSVTRVSFKPGSDTLLTSAGSDGIVCVFDISNSTEDDALQMTFNIECCVNCLGWCGDSHSNMYCVTSDHRFYAWDALEGNDRCVVPRDSILTEFFNITCRNPGSQRNSLPAVGKNAREYLVDCIPDLTTARLQGTGSLLVAGSYAGSLTLLWNDGDRDSVVTSLSGGHTDTVRCLHWDTQTKTLLTGGEDSSLCLWSGLDVPNAMVKMKIGKNQGASKKKPYDKKNKR